MTMNLIEYDFRGLIVTLFKRDDFGHLVQRERGPGLYSSVHGARVHPGATGLIPKYTLMETFQTQMRKIRKLVYAVTQRSLDDLTLPQIDGFKLLQFEWSDESMIFSEGSRKYALIPDVLSIGEKATLYKASGFDMFYLRDHTLTGQNALGAFMYNSLRWTYDLINSINFHSKRLEYFEQEGFNQATIEEYRVSRMRMVKKLASFVRSLENALGEAGSLGPKTRAIRMNIKIVENFVELNKKRSMKDFVLDYDGNTISSDEALVLTSQSQHEGEYIHSNVAIRYYDVDVDGGQSTIILTPFDDDEVVELVSGNFVWLPDFSDSIAMITAGSREGEYDWIDDLLYCDSDGEYYHHDDENNYVWWDDRNEEYVNREPRYERTHEYHSGFRKILYNNDTKFTIGFEVEKEDEQLLDDYDLDEVDDTKWCRESDGSLGNDGYELVSPVYDLFTDDIDIALNGEGFVSRMLVEHISADYTSNCGGHINIGQIGKSGEAFFDSIQAFVPLFLTIWRHRLGNSYSQIKRKPSDYKNAGKYSAIHIKNKYVELRLPPAVRNVTNLLWRRDLMRIVCENQNLKPLNVISMMLNPKSKLHRLLRKVYSVDMIHKIVSLYAQFADDLYSSYDFTSDGVGVFIKSAVRRLKNRKIKGNIIVSNTFEATTRLSNTFGSAYDMDNEETAKYLDKVAI